MSAPTTSAGGQTCWNCRQPLPPGSARCVYCGSPQQAQSAPLVVAPHGVVAAAPPGAPVMPGAPGGLATAPGAPGAGITPAGPYPGTPGPPTPTRGAPAAVADLRGIVHGQRTAGVGARLAAFTVDVIVVAAVGVAAQLLLRSPVLTAVIVAEVLLGLVVLQARTGLGIGNLLLRIRVARLDRPWSPGLGRSLLRGVITSAGWLVGGIGAWFVEITAAFDGSGRRRSWGDLAAGTVVVAVPKRARGAAAQQLHGGRPAAAPGSSSAPGMPAAAPALASTAVPLSLDPASGLGGVPATGSVPVAQPGGVPGAIAPMPGLVTPGMVPLGGAQPGAAQPTPAQPDADPPAAAQHPAAQPPVAPPTPATPPPARAPGQPGGASPSEPIPAQRPFPQQPVEQQTLSQQAPPAAPPNAVAPPPGIAPPTASAPVPPAALQPGAGQPGTPATAPQPGAPAHPAPAGDRQGAGGRVAYSLPPDSASPPADASPGRGAPGDWHTELTLTELRGRARVVLTFDTGQQEQAPIPATVLLGRNPSADDALEIAVAVRDPESTVSKGHARLELTRQGTWVTDSGSTNGTFLVDETGEAERLAPGVRTPVDDGARVRLGNRVFTISTLLEDPE
ncbi:FHA domain-containing protein [Schumannella soli]|uniref:FHA domain-containing protein n=1 Tax=Schumannella soli TaxID=2590779 RepID=A0A506XY59_9MICO|nr:FHA domain-containing protein [Schumannella soli]TPW77844.1 FHA domain-containing protein [Schumannella soli]